MYFKDNVIIYLLWPEIISFTEKFGPKPKTSKKIPQSSTLTQSQNLCKDNRILIS